MRPRLSRDTVTRAMGPITLRLWTDVRGRPQVRVVKARQAVAFDQEIHEMKAPPLPKPDIGFLPRIWLFIKDASTLVVLLIVGGVVWFIIGFIRRNRPQV